MRKKILFVINTMGQAGAEMALIELLKKLDNMNTYDLYLYSIIPCGELFKRVPKNIKNLNKRIYDYSLNSLMGKMVIIKTIVFSLLNRFTGFAMIPYMIKNIYFQKKTQGRVQYDKLLWRLLAMASAHFDKEFDLAIAYIEGAATYFVAEKVKARRKAAFVHIDYSQAGYSPFMDKNCYGKMSRIYVVSNGVGEQFSQVYPEHENKIKLFRNLLDRDLIHKKALNGEGFNDGFEGVRLVTVGRLHYQKGYDIAIKALYKLIQEDYNVRWYIVGEGDERANLEADIEKYNLKNNFILMGKKDNPYPYIKEADIYVQASRFEGKSIAIEEAQILEKAIIASNCTGNIEQIISDFDGKLFDLTAENLTNEIKNIIHNPDLRRKYEKNVKLKKLEYPEDLEDMISLMV